MSKFNSRKKKEIQAFKEVGSKSKLVKPTKSRKPVANGFEIEGNFFGPRFLCIYYFLDSIQEMIFNLGFSKMSCEAIQNAIIDGGQKNKDILFFPDFLGMGFDNCNVIQALNRILHLEFNENDLDVYSANYIDAMISQINFLVFGVSSWTEIEKMKAGKRIRKDIDKFKKKAMTFVKGFEEKVKLEDFVELDSEMKLLEIFRKLPLIGNFSREFLHSTDKIKTHENFSLLCSDAFNPFTLPKNPRDLLLLCCSVKKPSFVLMFGDGRYDLCRATYKYLMMKKLLKVIFIMSNSALGFNENSELDGYLEIIEGALKEKPEEMMGMTVERVGEGENLFYEFSFEFKNFLSYHKELWLEQDCAEDWKIRDTFNVSKEEIKNLIITYKNNEKNKLKMSRAFGIQDEIVKRIKSIFVNSDFLPRLKAHEGKHLIYKELIVCKFTAENDEEKNEHLIFLEYLELQLLGLQHLQQQKMQKKDEKNKNEIEGKRQELFFNIERIQTKNQEQINYAKAIKEVLKNIDQEEDNCFDLMVSISRNLLEFLKIKWKKEINVIEGDFIDFLSKYEIPEELKFKNLEEYEQKKEVFLVYLSDLEDFFNKSISFQFFLILWLFKVTKLHYNCMNFGLETDGFRKNFEEIMFYMLDSKRPSMLLFGEKHIIAQIEVFTQISEFVTKLNSFIDFFKLMISKEYLLKEIAPINLCKFNENKEAKELKVDEMRTSFTEEISEKTEEISEKTEEISEKKEEISEKTEEISEKTEEISEKTEEISEKTEEISEKTEEMLEITQTLERIEKPKKIEEVAKDTNELTEDTSELTEDINKLTENKEVKKTEKTEEENPQAMLGELEIKDETFKEEKCKARKKLRRRRYESSFTTNTNNERVIEFKEGMNIEEHYEKEVYISFYVFNMGFVAERTIGLPVMSEYEKCPEVCFPKSTGMLDFDGNYLTSFIFSVLSWITSRGFPALNTRGVSALGEKINRSENICKGTIMSINGSGKGRVSAVYIPKFQNIELIIFLAYDAEHNYQTLLNKSNAVIEQIKNKTLKVLKLNPLLIASMAYWGRFEERAIANGADIKNSATTLNDFDKFKKKIFTNLSIESKEIGVEL